MAMVSDCRDRLDRLIALLPRYSIDRGGSAVKHERPLARATAPSGQLRIEPYPVAALRPYARNARVHSKKQIHQIASSIEEFGFNNPVLIDKHDGIIAGHGRVEAAKLLKMKLV